MTVASFLVCPTQTQQKNSMPPYEKLEGNIDWTALPTTLTYSTGIHPISKYDPVGCTHKHATTQWECNNPSLVNNKVNTAGGEPELSCP